MKPVQGTDGLRTDLNSLKYVPELHARNDGPLFGGFEVIVVVIIIVRLTDNVRLLSALLLLTLFQLFLFLLLLGVSSSSADGAAACREEARREERLPLRDNRREARPGAEKDVTHCTGHQGAEMRSSSLLNGRGSGSKGGVLACAIAARSFAAGLLLGSSG